VTVDVRDAADNLVASSAADVSLAQAGGAGTVTGVPSTIHALAGVATFPVTGATAGAVQLQASAGGVQPASSSFSVVPGAPDHLTFVSSTADLASGASRALTVQVRDAAGNQVQAAPSITFAKSGGSGTVVGLPTTANAAAGAAVTSITGFLGGGITVTAGARGLGAGSTSFNIAPGPRKRTVSLKLAKRRLSGAVRAGASVCRERVPVQIQVRVKKSRRWKRLKTVRTRTGGGFSIRVSKIGTYRARIAARPGCGAATSRTRRLRA
jgi:hypothetical protein